MYDKKAYHLFFYCWLGITLVILLFCLLNDPNQIMAQSASNGIHEPENGATIGGVIIVEGTATDPNYLRYELAFLSESNPTADWIVFAEGDQQLVDGTLAVWDTTIGRQIGSPVFPDGRYQLRLRIVRTDYNYDEYYITNLIISNDEPTPTITPTVTTTVNVPQITPPNQFQQPTPLPSLTPFPTPSPQATPLSQTVGPTTNQSNGGGLLGQLATIDSTRFIRAFWQGAILASYIFIALALYILLRNIGRRLWRMLLRRITR